eukprot:2864046-Rhodomonas_salina.1
MAPSSFLSRLLLFLLSLLLRAAALFSASAPACTDRGNWRRSRGEEGENEDSFTPLLVRVGKVLLNTRCRITVWPAKRCVCTAAPAHAPHTQQG